MSSFIRFLGGILFLTGFFFGVRWLSDPDMKDSLLMIFPYLGMLLGIHVIVIGHDLD